MRGGPDEDPPTVRFGEPTPLGGRTTIGLGAQTVGVEADPATDPVIRGGALEILGPLGEGGMGLVQEAREPDLLRTVAVKTAREPRYSAELVREALVLSALEHPNIVPIYALEPGPRVVLRKIGGATWDTLIHDPDAATAAARGEELLSFHLRVLMAVCDAIAHAHSRRILHRDLKPENVMIGEHGQFYVLDWGLAVSLDPDDARPIPRAVDQVGKVAGTPACMPPEQARGERLAETADIYALGAILHEVLTRTPRNGGETLEAVLASAREPVAVAYPPEIDPYLGDLANQMTAASPHKRPASVEDVHQALVRWQQYRASLELTRRAEEQFRLARGARANVGERAHVLGLVSEATALLDQALDLWPENTRADVLATLVRRESVGIQLALGNLSVARSMLADAEPDDDLRNRLEDLHAQHDAEAREVEALRHFAQEHAATVDRLPRTIVGLFGTVLVGVLCLGMAVLDRLFGPLGYAVIVPGVLLFGLGMAVFVTVLIRGGNRRSGRLARLFLGVTLGVVVHWMAAALLVLPIPVALAWNCLVAWAALLAGGGAAGDRPAILASVPYVLGFVGILAVPWLGWELYAVANTLSYATWTALHGAARDTGPTS